MLETIIIPRLKSILFQEFRFILKKLPHSLLHGCLSVRTNQEKPTDNFNPEFDICRAMYRMFIVKLGEKKISSLLIDDKIRLPHGFYQLLFPNIPESDYLGIEQRLIILLLLVCEGVDSGYCEIGETEHRHILLKAAKSGYVDVIIWAITQNIIRLDDPLPKRYEFGATTLLECYAIQLEKLCVGPNQNAFNFFSTHQERVSTNEVQSKPAYQKLCHDLNALFSNERIKRVLQSQSKAMNYQCSGFSSLIAHAIKILPASGVKQLLHIARLTQCKIKIEKSSYVDGLKRNESSILLELIKFDENALVSLEYCMKQPNLITNNEIYVFLRACYEAAMPMGIKVTECRDEIVEARRTGFKEQPAHESFLRQPLCAHQTSLLNTLTLYEFEKAQRDMPILLGQGATSLVYLGHIEESPQQNASQHVAIKLYTKEFNTRLECLKEVKLLKACANPQIVRCFGVGLCETSAGYEYSLILEYSPMNNLSTYLASAQPLAAKQIAKFATDISTAVSYCHQQEVVLVDFKTENILVFPGEHRALSQAKLTDFGMAKSLVEPHDNSVLVYIPITSALYCPPEVFKSQWILKTVAKKTDCYRLGFVLWETAHAKPIWDEVVSQEMLENKLKDHQRPPLEHIQTLEEASDPNSQNIQAMNVIISHLWPSRPTERIEASQACAASSRLLARLN